MTKLRLKSLVAITESGAPDALIYTATNNGTGNTIGGHGISDYHLPAGGNGSFTFKVDLQEKSFYGLTTNPNPTGLADIETGVALLLGDNYHPMFNGSEAGWGAPAIVNGALIRLTRTGTTVNVAYSIDAGATFTTIWDLTGRSAEAVYFVAFPTLNTVISKLAGTGGIGVNRPVSPLGIDSTNAFAAGAVIYPLATGNLQSLDAGAYPVALAGSTPPVANSDGITTAGGFGSTSRIGLGIHAAFNNPVFTRVITFDFAGAAIDLFNTNYNGSGGGYSGGAVYMGTIPDGSFFLNKDNIAAIFTSAAGILHAGENTVGISCDANGAILFSVNGVAAGSATFTNGFVFGDEVLGAHDDFNGGAAAKFKWYTVYPGVAKNAADLNALTASPAQMVKTASAPANMAIGSAATSIAGGSIRLNFTTSLKLPIGNPVAAFSVPGHTVTAVSGGAVDTQLVIAVAPNFTQGETIAFSYTKPVSNFIQDTDGGTLASFTNQAVNNIVNPAITDTTPPTLVSAVTSADGTSVELTFSESLAVTVTALSAFPLTGHTASALAIASNKVTLSGITPAITISDVPDVSYVKPGSNPITDIAGNQLASFGSTPVTNNVAPYEWVYLGGEGANATVPTNTLVRYGATGAYVTKVMSGAFSVNNATFTDPAPGASKHADAFLPVPTATAIVVTMTNGGPVGNSPSYRLAANGILNDAVTIELSGAGLTFTPSSITLGPNRSGYASGNFTISATQPTDSVVHFASTSAVAMPADQPYRADYAIVRTITNNTEFRSFSDYVRGLDVVGMGVSVVAELTQSMSADGVNLLPATSNEDCHVIVRPAAGLGMSALGPVNFNVTGLTLSSGFANGFNVNQGCELVGVNVDLTDDPSSAGRSYYAALGAAANGYGQGGAYQPTFTNCRIRAANSNRSLGFGGYGVRARMRSCLIIQEGPDQVLFNDQVDLQGCGIVRKGVFTTRIFNDVSLVAMENSWGINCGSRLTNSDSAWNRFLNNVFDTAITGGSTVGNQDMAQVGYVLANNFVVDANSDYTPSAAGALIGAANLRARSTNDLRGNNRGLTPDIGPVQRTPATPLTVARVTSVLGPDGQSVTWSGTTTNNPTSAFLSLVPNSPDTTRSGPYPVTLGDGTFSVELDTIEPGSHIPVFSFFNAGGVSGATGAPAFEIAGVGGLTFDSGASGTGGTDPVPAAPVVTRSTQDGQILSGKTATISGSVDFQGDLNGSVAVFADPQPSGAAISLGAATVASGLYSKQATLPKGSWKLRVVVTANGQTSSIQTGALKVVGITPSVFTLPVA
jgi:hypothetical protein